MTSFMVAAILSEFALADKLVYGPGLGSEVGFPSLRYHKDSQTRGIRGRQRTVGC